jgi:Ni,Fe-hydrogenase III small subunit
MSPVSPLSVLVAVVVALSGCEDEPQQTRERLDKAIGQKEVQDLFRDADEGDQRSPQQEDRQEGDD